MRGNLYQSKGRWILRFVPRGESWQLAIQRDVIDASMLRVAAKMVWFPVRTVARISEGTCSTITLFTGCIHSVAAADGHYPAAAFQKRQRAVLGHDHYWDVLQPTGYVVVVIDGLGSTEFTPFLQD